MPLRQHLAALLWLRWRLGMRGMNQSKLNLVGTVIGLVLAIPTALALGVGAGALLWYAPSVWHATILKCGLLAIWLSWSLAPVIGVRLSDAWDMGRLLGYPISPKRLFAASILGAFGDFSTLFVLPMLLGAIVVAFFWGSLAGLMALIVVPLFLFQTLALAQATALGLSGAIKSRKWRDAAIVIGPLIAMSFQFARFFARAIDWNKFLDHPLWKAGDWVLPPGMAARAISEAAQGSPLCIAFLVLLLLITALTVTVAGWLIGKVYDGEEITLTSGGPRRAGRSVAIRPDRLTFLPPAVAGIIEKEWRYFQRDPYFRAVGMNLVYLLVIAAASLFLRQGKRGGGDFNTILMQRPEWAIFPVLGGLLLVMLSESQVLYNQFGVDGGAAGLLFGFPVERRQYFIGKNLAQISVLIPINVFLGLVLCLIVHQLQFFGVAVAFVLLMLPLILAVGNLFSVFFPHKVVLRGARLARATGYGLAYGLAWMGSGIRRAAALRARRRGDSLAMADRPEAPAGGHDSRRRALLRRNVCRRAARRRGVPARARAAGHRARRPHQRRDLTYFSPASRSLASFSLRVSRLPDSSVS